MKYLRKFSTETDVAMDIFPNVVLVEDTKKVLYNVAPIGVFIQHIDGSLHTMEAWTAAGFSNDEANGVAVNAKEAGFVIAKNLLGTNAWSSNTSDLLEGILTTTNSTEAKKDFAGAANTAIIVAASTSGAAVDCNNYTFPNGAKGYLPASGELYVAYNNKASIDAAMTLIGGSGLSSNFYWSSTQYSATSAWYLYWSPSGMSDDNKANSFSVRAFSALEI